jgi:hypothetical protein
MTSRAIGFCFTPVDNGTYFIVVTPWCPPSHGHHVRREPVQSCFCCMAS